MLTRETKAADAWRQTTAINDAWRYQKLMRVQAAIPTTASLTKCFSKRRN